MRFEIIPLFFFFGAFVVVGIEGLPEPVCSKSDLDVMVVVVAAF
jgi:hypothetical protein